MDDVSRPSRVVSAAGAGDAGGAGREWAWRRWHVEWHPTPGRHVLGAWATDASGRTPPVGQPWNRGGFADNLMRRVEVVALAE